MHPCPSGCMAEDTTLARAEMVWRSRYEWLKDCGFELRPKFRPDWVPPWAGTSKSAADFEEGLQMPVRSFFCLSALYPADTVVLGPFSVRMSSMPDASLTVAW